MKNRPLYCLSISICFLASALHAQPRWIKVACTHGPGLEHYGLKAFEKALDFAGKNGVDLVLLPEYVNGEMVPEPMSGPSSRLMSEKARKYCMYVAGTIARQDGPPGKLYNTAMLFDRKGALLGTYDKIHLYGDELAVGHMTPGTNMPVFQTDFGKVAFVTCNDIAFSDVAATATNQGADLLMFPNLGYDRAVARARAAENGVWMLASSRSGPHNVWDGSGFDVLTTGTRENISSRDVIQHRIGELGILVVSLKFDRSPGPSKKAPAPGPS